MAEGLGRQRSSEAEFRRYLVMALGSADEVQLWCRYARDLGYVDAATHDAWLASASAVSRMLQGLIRKLGSAAIRRAKTAI